jgi:hypothetical protein
VALDELLYPARVAANAQLLPAFGLAKPEWLRVFVVRYAHTLDGSAGGAINVP